MCKKRTVVYVNYTYYAKHDNIGIFYTGVHGCMVGAKKPYMSDSVAS